MPSMKLFNPRLTDSIRLRDYILFVLFGHQSYGILSSNKLKRYKCTCCMGFSNDFGKKSSTLIVVKLYFTFMRCGFRQAS